MEGRGYETAARAGTAPRRGLGYERADRFSDRREVRSEGAMALAKGGRLGRAVRLILNNYRGRAGKLTDLEVRFRHNEVQRLEIAADDAEREARAKAANDRLRRKLDAAMR